MVPRSLRDPVGRRSILDRLVPLTPEHSRRWGRMPPAQLLPHLAGGLRMALGEVTLQGSPPGAVRGAFWRYLAIHRLRWPEGKIQSPPGAFSTPSLGWERDRELVVELIDRFATALSDKLGVIHPNSCLNRSRYARGLAARSMYSRRFISSDSTRWPNSFRTWPSSPHVTGETAPGGGGGV
jgi:hypothetical protein